jgi:hypothetical protein
MTKEWTKALKVGDKVAITIHNVTGQRTEITTVKKITPTGMIRTTNDNLFKGGYCKFGVWSHAELIECTPELEERLRKEKHFRLMVSEIDNTYFAKLSYEKVERLYDIIEEAMNDK